MNLSKQTTVIEKTQKPSDEMLDAIIAILNVVMENTRNIINELILKYMHN